MFSFRATRAAKGGERPATLTPQRVLANWQRWEELRRAAGRLLVAGIPVRDLLLRAKHLFVAATVGCAGEIQPSCI